MYWHNTVAFLHSQTVKTVVNNIICWSDHIFNTRKEDIFLTPLNGSVRVLGCSVRECMPCKEQKEKQKVFT